MPESPASPGLTRILAVAERLFGDRGYDGVSIGDVAGEAGVSKANVFHHFADKQTLYERVLADACARLDVELKPTLDIDADARGRIAHIVASYRRYLRSHPSTARLLLRELIDHRDCADSGRAFELFVRLLDKLAAPMREARVGGDFHYEINPTLVASMLLGITLFDAQTEHLRDAIAALRDVDEDSVSMLTDLLLDGLLRERVA